MPLNRWIYPKLNIEEARSLRQTYQLPPIVADILAARALPAYEVAEFLSSGEPEDPMLLPDMEKAVRRIEAAIDCHEKIAVYGDYDCDGVTATVLLYSYLFSMGANVIYYIPDRLDEGFGMNMGAIDRLHHEGVRLIVTVDNGTSAIAEIEYATGLGIDVVVTDHHQPGEKLPVCTAVVNPHLPQYEGFKNLCGAGVALKLVAALEGGDFEAALSDFSELAAIGTVGDVVPLTAENRLIVSSGLQALPNTDRPGLRALMELAGIGSAPTAGQIAFGICPRINAAGRMGSAALGVELLLCEDEERAAELAAELNDLNTRRRDSEEEILAAITKELEEKPELLLDRVLVVGAEGLNHGVVGIVASRLVTLYGKPTFVMSVEGDVAVGSARSLGDFSLFKAITACSDLCIKYGGHTLAAGLTIPADKMDEFRRRINRYAAKVADRMPVGEIIIDKTLKAHELTLDTVESLSYLEPYGEGNREPVFLLKNCYIEGFQSLSGGKHLKLRVNFEGRSIYILWFRMSPERCPYRKNDCVDMLVNLELNSFREMRSISVRLKDIRPVDMEEEKMLSARHYYEKLRREEPVDRRIAAHGSPDITELRGLYRLLMAAPKDIDPDAFYLSEVGGKMNYCKYLIGLDIFKELGLISLPSDRASVNIIPSGKVDLESSSILQAVRRQST